jgi:hypothetical protein
MTTLWNDADPAKSASRMIAPSAIDIDRSSPERFRIISRTLGGKFSALTDPAGES